MERIRNTMSLVEIKRCIQLSNYQKDWFVIIASYRWSSTHIAIWKNKVSSKTNNLLVDLCNWQLLGMQEIRKGAFQKLCWHQNHKTKNNSIQNNNNRKTKHKTKRLQISRIQRWLFMWWWEQFWRMWLVCIVQCLKCGTFPFQLSVFNNCFMLSGMVEIVVALKLINSFARTANARIPPSVPHLLPHLGQLLKLPHLHLGLQLLLEFVNFQDTWKMGLVMT